MKLVKLPEIPEAQNATRAIEKAAEEGLNSVMIIGTREDGTLYWQTSHMSCGESLFYLELMKKYVMDDVA